MEKLQPHGRRQHARQPSEGFNSTRNFLLPFFLEEYFHCTTLSALVLSGVSAHEKLAWPGPCFLNLQIIGISK